MTSSWDWKMKGFSSILPLYIISCFIISQIISHSLLWNLIPRAIQGLLSSGLPSSMNPLIPLTPIMSSLISFFIQQPLYWQGFPLPGSVVTLKRSLSSPSNTEWVTSIYTRTIQRSGCMGVNFPLSSCQNMFQWNCFLWNTIGRCAAQIWSILLKQKRKHNPGSHIN